MKDKHFIEFCDHIFAIEDVTLVERYYDYRSLNNGDKEWHSLVRLGDNIYCRFPEDKYEHLKLILLEFSNKKQL